VDRRAAENIQSLSTPFDDAKFNFTRVRRDEMLFQLRSRRHGNDDVSGEAVSQQFGQVDLIS